MIKHKLYVTRLLPDEVEARLASEFDQVAPRNARDASRRAIIAGAAHADALLVAPGDPIDAGLIGHLPERIRIIATFSAGTDHIDVKAAAARAIAVTNTPDVLTEATADIALLLILGAARGAGPGEQTMRRRAWRGWGPAHVMGVDLKGRRLGIFGMGRIGQAVAARARAFGLIIHYHNRTRLPPESEAGAHYHATGESLIAASDILSLHCPSTPETRNYLSRERIALLPAGAILVNTARGDLIDDDALIEALENGRLFAAGLDVFRGEPDFDPRYARLTNTFLLPHLGSSTRETRNAMGFRALDNLADFFAGRRPRNLVTP